MSGRVGQRKVRVGSDEWIVMVMRGLLRVVGMFVEV